MSQTVYSLAVILLGIANVVLAGIAYSQRARQLASRALGERQLALAARRNQMAEQRIERLDQQVSLLRAIRDTMATDPRDAETPTAGVIDVGSTTVRMVVVRQRADGSLKRIANDRAYLHLAAEVERRGWYETRTLRAVATRVAALEHQAACAGATRLSVVLTAPSRLGQNPEQLVAAVEEASCSPVRALTPADEARLAFLGASSAAAPDLRLVVCDVGGGSTELAWGTAAHGVERTRCFDTGALALAERFLPCSSPSDQDLETLRSQAEHQLDLEGLTECDLLLATGGSARAVARLVGPVADAAALERALELAVRQPKSVRKRLSPERRRSLPAGIVILQLIQGRLGVPVTVSRGGMREGVIQELLAA